MMLYLDLKKVSVLAMKDKVLSALPKLIIQKLTDSFCMNQVTPRLSFVMKDDEVQSIIYSVK